MLFCSSVSIRKNVSNKIRTSFLFIIIDPIVSCHMHFLNQAEQQIHLRMLSFKILTCQHSTEVKILRYLLSKTRWDHLSYGKQMKVPVAPPRCTCKSKEHLGHHINAGHPEC